MNPFFPSRFRVVKASAMRPKALRLQYFAHTIYILISASGKVHNKDLIALHITRRFDCLRDSVRRLERRNDTFEFRQELKRFKGVAVRDRNVLDTTSVMQECMFR